MRLLFKRDMASGKKYGKRKTPFGLALGASLALHAAVLPFIVPQEREYPPEVLMVEYTPSPEDEQQENKDGELSAPIATTLQRKEVEDGGSHHPEAAPRRYWQRMRRKTLTGASPIGSLPAVDSVPESPLAGETEERPAAGILAMRDKSVPMLPSEKQLEEIVSASLQNNPPRPAIKEQNPDGTYTKYEDGSTLVRSPSFGPYAVVADTINSAIAVNEHGRVYGEEAQYGIPDSVDLGLLERQAHQISARCSLDKESDSPPQGLAILIDSSGSMVADINYTAPSTTCGYRIALEAVRRGSQVQVFNFSSTTHIGGKTSNLKAIAKALGRVEGGSTILPTLELQSHTPSNPHDIVIITDGYIDNYKEALPYYQHALQQHKDNKGYLIVIGENSDQEFNDFRQQVIEKFEDIGFKVLYHG